MIQELLVYDLSPKAEKGGKIFLVVITIMLSIQLFHKNKQFIHNVVSLPTTNEHINQTRIFITYF